MMADLFYKKTDKLNRAEQSTAAHSLLKSCLAVKFGRNASEIEIKKDERGCPFVDFADGIFVSISHTDGLVACALAGGRVGVDAEKIANRRPRVEPRVYTPAEISLIDGAENSDFAFFQLWTLKEAYLKAIGTGFAGNAKELEITSLKPIASNHPSFEFASYVYEGYIISVCVEKCND